MENWKIENAEEGREAVGGWNRCMAGLLYG